MALAAATHHSGPREPKKARTRTDHSSSDGGTLRSLKSSAGCGQTGSSTCLSRSTGSSNTPWSRSSSPSSMFLCSRWSNSWVGTWETLGATMPQMEAPLDSDEEVEEELYSQRVKSHRCRDNEREGRRTGNAKLLTHMNTGKILFMLRDTTTRKIVGNFFVTNGELKHYRDAADTVVWLLTVLVGVGGSACLASTFASRKLTGKSIRAFEQVKGQRWPLPALSGGGSTLTLLGRLQNEGFHVHFRLSRFFGDLDQMQCYYVWSRAGDGWDTRSGVLPAVGSRTVALSLCDVHIHTHLNCTVSNTNNHHTGSNRLRCFFFFWCDRVVDVEVADLRGGWWHGDLRWKAEERAVPALVVATRVSERPHGADRCRSPQRREGCGRRELRLTGTDDGQRRVSLRSPPLECERAACPRSLGAPSPSLPQLSDVLDASALSLRSPSSWQWRLRSRRRRRVSGRRGGVLWWQLYGSSGSCGHAPPHLRVHQEKLCRHRQISLFPSQ